MGTTARTIYELACRLIYEEPDDDEDFIATFPVMVNLCMMEALPYESNWRETKNEPPIDITMLPTITSVNDMKTLPFDERILRLALPYGVKSLFLESEDDKKAESVIAWNKFIQTLEGMSPGVIASAIEW